MTPTEAITALEKALEAGPTQEWKAATEPNGHSNGWRAGPDAWLGVSAHSKETAAAAAFIAACSPLAIRTLLDAHAGALRDAVTLHSALARLETAVDWHLGRSGFTQSVRLKGVEHSANVRKELYAAHDAARAALATNTESATADGPESVRQLLVDAAIAYDDARVRRSKARAHQRKLLRDYMGNEGSYYDAAEDRQPEIDSALVEGIASSKAKISAHAKLIRAIKATRAALATNTKAQP